MRVVVVNESVAFPPKGGNWLRTINLMLPLAGRHDITYVSRGLRDKDAVETAKDFYGRHGIRAIITDDYPPENRGAAFVARLAANLASPLPYSIAVHQSRAVKREIHRIASTEHVDLWQYEALAYGDTLLGRDERTILMAHNVDSLIWQRLYETASNPIKRAYLWHQWRKHERFEARVAQGVSKVVAVSREDAALMESRFGVGGAAVVDNGVDVGFFREAREARSPNPKQIVFLGSLDWRPNLDSIDLLIKRILPQVWQQEPDARLVIVGRNPPPALVRSVAALDQVEIHADVPDVRPYLSASAIMAVPLRIGGGSRLKIIEAVAAGVPVVSTRVGCEGLIFEADRDLVIVNDERQMADAIVATLRDPLAAEARARRALQVVETHYDWSHLAKRLEAVWLACAGRPATR